MKKLALGFLSLLLVFSVAFSNVASAKTIFDDFVTYGNSNAMLLMKSDGEARLVTPSPEGTLNVFSFKDIILTAFGETYFSYIDIEKDEIDIEKDEQYLFFFSGSSGQISLNGYTPIFFGGDHITLRKEDTYYEVDMEKTSATSELVVIPID